jgi:antitoxin component YwqK of YwqJK toxin-antitoxin module
MLIGCCSNQPTYKLRWQIKSNGEIVGSGGDVLINGYYTYPSPLLFDPKFTGVLKTWHDNGQLALLSLYINGKRTNTEIAYLPDGSILQENLENKDEVKALYWHENNNENEIKK